MMIITRHRPLLYFIVVGCTLLLTGCSYFANFFVVNNTGNEVTAIIKMDSRVAENLKDGYSLRLKYAEGILKVNDKTADRLIHSLDYQQLDSFRISIRIPPNSTALIGSARSRPLSADSVTLVTNDSATHYSLYDIHKQTKRTGGLLPPYHLTYTIE